MNFTLFLYNIKMHLIYASLCYISPQQKQINQLWDSMDYTNNSIYSFEDVDNEPTMMMIMIVLFGLMIMSCFGKKPHWHANNRPNNKNMSTCYNTEPHSRSRDCSTRAYMISRLPFLETKTFLLHSSSSFFFDMIWLQKQESNPTRRLYI